MIVIRLVAFACALVAGLFLTALVRKLATRFGLLDHPDSRRKLHAQPVALGGGLAVFLTLCSTLLLLVLVPTPLRAALLQDGRSLSGLLLAGAIVVLVGLIDDRVKLRGHQKLIGQTLAASVLIGSGLMIERFEIFGVPIHLGLLSVPITLFWLLGATNAINLIDGIDGLATTIGIILAITVAGMAAMTGQASVGIVAIVLAGSLTAFLFFNFPPAKMFLGDAGSLLIGMTFGALAIQGAFKGAGTVLLAALLATWALPLFDSTVAILRRKLTGRSIYSTDYGHIHHRLLDALGNNRRALAVIGLASAITSAAALGSVAMHNDLVALLTCIGVVAVFIASGVFGKAEFMLLMNRLRSAGRSIMHLAAGRRGVVQVSEVHLQGSRPWNQLWTALTEHAERLHLTSIILDLNLPRIHEGYTANWDRSFDGDKERLWRTEMPIVVAGQAVGRLTVMGQRTGESALADIGVLIELLEPFIGVLTDLLEPLESQLQSMTNAEPVSASAGNGGSIRRQVAHSETSSIVEDLVEVAADGSPDDDFQGSRVNHPR